MVRLTEKIEGEDPIVLVALLLSPDFDIAILKKHNEDEPQFTWEQERSRVGLDDFSCHGSRIR